MKVYDGVFKKPHHKATIQYFQQKFDSNQYHNVLQLGELLTNSMAKNTIETTVLKEAMTGHFNKIDSAESYIKANEDINSRFGYQLAFKKKRCNKTHL